VRNFFLNILSINFFLDFNTIAYDAVGGNQISFNSGNAYYRLSNIILNSTSNCFTPLPVQNTANQEILIINEIPELQIVSLPTVGDSPVKLILCGQLQYKS